MLNEATSQQAEPNAETHNHSSIETQSEPKRVNRGYQLREDLIKDLRRVVLNEDRKLLGLTQLAVCRVS